jgi:lysophospholipase L1-like esterase
VKHSRPILLLAALAALGWFQFVNAASARELTRSVLDLFDGRPAQDVLFVGNSRMFENDMPAMVRAIADSAGAPVKYRVRMWARPGARFTDHADDARLGALLDRRWDLVLLQAESGAHRGEARRAAFTRDGKRLVARAAAAGSRASLIVNWEYGARDYRGWSAAERAGYHDAIQRDYRALAAEARAGLIDVGGGWKAVRAARPELRLDRDGNHPSTAGTYLTALIVYAALGGGDLAAVTYVPNGIKAADAAALRRLAAEHARP